MHNAPSYYKSHKFECLEEMRLIFGVEAVKNFCKLNIWKYRYRDGNKLNTNDSEKADEYLTYLLSLEKRGVWNGYC